MTHTSMKLTVAGLATVATVLLANATVSADTYTVKEGDTLSTIAKEKETTVEKLVELNKLTNPDTISVGQELEVGDAPQAEDLPLPNKKLPRLRRGGAGQVVADPATTVINQTSAYQAEAVSPTQVAQTPAYSGALANGNTAGATGSYAAARMAELTGVDAGTWEHIIARESNGNVNAYNPSGASGLFQTMPGWGSTATVDDQINAAVRAYNAQGLSAWGY